MSVAGSILDLVGNTPLIRVHLFEESHPGVEFYAKAEWFNPGGSVKDRPAKRMIEEAEKSGELTPDRIILDSTSGNTGIGYALVAAAKGYRLRLVMPGNVSKERIETVRAHGAEITFSDPGEGSDGAILVARQMVEEHPDLYYMPDQYNNPNNPRAHYETTAPEIIEQTGGRITHFVAGLGTSGTIVGTGRRLHEHDPEIKIVAVQPSSSWHGLEGLKHIPTAIRPGIYDETVHDLLLDVETEDAYDLARRLARSEGILAGHSSGAALWGAAQVTQDLDEAVVVMIFPDGGDRYLSGGLYVTNL
ncbi:MAG TPA: cysteine synthase family protein [Candidatus Dormibacteraeota bacterium]|jgi:cysteine synthase B|nr:cysteine synthase family protein [Candidatus Dormibacteraeota bacterium]